jgi:hypothetical protein
MPEPQRLSTTTPGDGCLTITVSEGGIPITLPRIIRAVLDKGAAPDDDRTTISCCVCGHGTPVIPTWFRLEGVLAFECDACGGLIGGLRIAEVA